MSTKLSNVFQLGEYFNCDNNLFLIRGDNVWYYFKLYLSMFGHLKSKKPFVLV